MYKIILLIIMTFIYVNKSESQVTVGWEAGCDYDASVDSNALQQAIDDLSSEIRITNENEYMTNIVIESNVIIKGGYDNCIDAGNDIQTNVNTIINAMGEGLPVIQMKFIENAEITLDSLTLTNGTGANNGDPTEYAGGIGVRNVIGDLNFSNLKVINNIGVFGGGLSVNDFQSIDEPLSLNINITQSNFAQNQAIDGGAIFCRNDTQDLSINFNLSNGVTVRENHATTDGGGFLLNNCKVNYTAGISNLTNSNSNFEILDNTADRTGGGIVANSGSEVHLMGTQSQAFDVSLNRSNLDVGNSGTAGAISSSGSNTIVNLYNSNVVSNSSGRYGGGLFSIFDGVINMTSDGDCSYDEYCSRLSNNTLTGTFPGGGGAIAARFSGAVNINKTLIEFNNSDQPGFIAYIESQASSIIENSLIANNGNDTMLNNNSAFYINSDSSLTLAYDTLDRNSSGAILLTALNNTVINLYGNIVNELSNTILSSQASSQIDINCNLLSQTDGISIAMTDTFVGVPDYFDISNHDYRLTSTSILAMDRCSSNVYLSSLDLDGNSRGVDNPDVIDTNGLFDLGAYEFQIITDVIFKNAFE